jgi:uncharacterized protein (TIGR02300 family)
MRDALARPGRRLCASGFAAIDRAVASRQGMAPLFKRSRTRFVAKPELGTKRVCPVTGRKFYDLNQTPVVSPYTGEVVPIEAPARGRGDAGRAAQRVEPEAAEAEGPEFVSLEEADAEAQGAKTPAADGDEDDADVEMGEEIAADEDDTFLEPSEDEDEDVSDIIGGDIEDEEET